MSAMEIENGGVEERKSSEGHAVASVDKIGSSNKRESERNVLLHPLAIINICDHQTRVSTGGGQDAKDSRVIGLLFGVQQGLDVHIYDSAETRFATDAEGNVTIIEEAAEKQKELFEAVYPTYEVMGWYSIGEDVRESDIAIQRQMVKFNESPLFLLMNSKPVQGAKELPLQIHESEVHMVNNQPALLFVPLNFQLETAQAEQISVEHVAKATPTDGVSSIDLHAETLGTSLRTLLSRIRVLKQFLQATREGKIEPDYRLLRQISNVCSQLPAVPLKDEFNVELSDALAVTYMATIQSNATALNDLVDKFALINKDKNRRGIM